MPEISRFFGIIICMYVNEHGKPHFHAYYQDAEIAVEIENGAVTGEFPPRVLGFVQEWRALHCHELLECWQNGTQTGKFTKIKPLE